MIIDGHVHITPGGWAAFNPERAHAMGLDALMAYSGAWGETGQSMALCRAQNDHLASLRDAHPRMVAPLPTAHPRFGGDAADEIERCIRRLGMPGVGFNPHQSGFGVLRASYTVGSSLARSPLCEMIRSLEVPVVFDCDYLVDYSSPAQIGELARGLRRNTIIMNHSGWNALWPMAIEVAMRAENLMLGTASLPTLGIRQAVERLGAERVIFGTDFPCDNGDTVAYELAKVHALRLPSAKEEAVLGGNLKRMLGW